MEQGGQDAPPERGGGEGWQTLVNKQQKRRVTVRVGSTRRLTAAPSGPVKQAFVCDFV